MILTLLLTAPLASCALPNAAQDDPPAVAQAQSYKELEAEFSTAHKKWMAAMDAASKEGTYPPFGDNPTKEFFARFRAVAKDVNSTQLDIGQAKLWCLMRLSDSGINWKSPVGVAEKMASDLFQNYAKEIDLAKVPDAISRFCWLDPEPTVKALANLVEVAPSIDLKVGLLIAQATIYADQLNDADTAIANLDLVAKDYGKSALAAKAEKLKNRIANLRVGGIAPEFQGVDVDGKTIKLSDYKGKVIFLDFWGFW